MKKSTSTRTIYRSRYLSKGECHIRLKLHDYRGCKQCPVNKQCQSAKKVPVAVTFLADQFAENWGMAVKVFQKGETAKGIARVLNGMVYCVTAKSRTYPEYRDYIQLNNIKVEPGN